MLALNLNDINCLICIALFTFTFNLLKTSTISVTFVVYDFQHFTLLKVSVYNFPLHTCYF